MTSASLFKLVFLAAIIGIASSVGLYEQCAGDGYGTFPCDAGLQCFRRNHWFSSCQFSCPRYQGWECEAYLPATPAVTYAAGWDQCGADVWYGPVTCAAGYACYARSIYYSQCRPIGDCPTGWACNAAVPVTAAPPSTYVPGGPTVLEMYSKCNGYTNAVCPAGTACYQNDATYAECRPSCPVGWACYGVATTLAPVTSGVVAGAWDQCGGNGWTGAYMCPDGYICYTRDVGFAQCRPAGDCPSGWSCPALATTAAPVPVYAGAYDQCGGNGWTGAYMCPDGYICYTRDVGFAQCRPAGDCPSGWSCPALATTAAPVPVYAGAYDQCGGNGWTGAYMCPDGYICYTRDATFAQCRSAGDCPSGWSCPVIVTTAAPTTVSAFAGAYDQCGGSGWAGAYICPDGFTCYARDATFSQCRMTDDCPSGWVCPVAVTTTAAPAPVILAAYSKCNDVANSVCAAGTACFRYNANYAECRAYCPAGWTCETDYAGVNEQCGGTDYVGLTNCAAGLACYARDATTSFCEASCPDASWLCATK